MSDEIKNEKPVIGMPDDLPIPISDKAIRIEEVYGTLPRTTAAPTWVPRNFREQFAVDETNNKLYVYDFTDAVWLNVSGGLAEYDNGNSGTSKTIDWNNGSVQRLTLTGNCVLTFSNLQSGGIYTLIVVQGSGPYTITWPTTSWENGTTPTLTVTNAKRDIFRFIQGASLFGSYAYNF